MSRRIEKTMNLEMQKRPNKFHAVVCPFYLLFGTAAGLKFTMQKYKFCNKKTNIHRQIEYLLLIPDRDYFRNAVWLIQHRLRELNEYKRVHLKK